jgi:hypothetical protein
MTYTSDDSQDGWRILFVLTLVSRLIIGLANRTELARRWHGEAARAILVFFLRLFSIVH